MTGEVNEKYLTPQERKARQMVKAVNEASLHETYRPTRWYAHVKMNIALFIRCVMHIPTFIVIYIFLQLNKHQIKR